MRCRHGKLRLASLLLKVSTSEGGITVMRSSAAAMFLSGSVGFEPASSSIGR
jgi:hypothetical protein